MISDIRLVNFRSYTDDSFEFPKNVNIIVGPNASGKTNLIEAILVVAQGSSYRGKDVELVMFNKPWSRVETHTEDNSDRIIKIERTGETTKKEFEINGQKYLRLSNTKTLPVVLFEPNYLQILSGSPDLRRQFLDNILDQTTLGYSSTRRQYRRALSQRNSLLKQGYSAAKNNLFVWDLKLSQLGEQIAIERAKLVEELNKQVEQVYLDIAKKPATLKVNYQTKLNIKNYASDLLSKLGVQAELDCLRGFTSYGPHRDELQLELNGHDVQESASRGEVRSILLSLKIIEAKLLEAKFGTKPILLLDDVFSELDGGRRQALTQFLQPYQAFITTTDADVVVQHFTETCNIIALSPSK